MAGIEAAGGFVGGLGLLLLGLWLATEGVKLAGGSVLKANLRSWARDRWRSFETGFAIALLVPGSGALTSATIGFVNCGLVTLENALWVVVGCGFGAVFTTWLVVAVGFGWALSAVASGLIGLGTALRLTGARTTRGAWGQVIIGLGCLFLGLSFMKESFAPLGEGFRLDAFGLPLGGRVAVCILVGGVIASLLRSGSAAMAIVIVAAAAGALQLTSAAALMVGANLGASTPAAFVLASGTAASRRVALGHVLYHVLTSSIGLLVLLWLLPVIVELQDPIAFPGLLAMYHLIFSLIGAMVLALLSAPLTAFLANRFRDAEEPDQPHIDANLLRVPDLALEGLIHEVAEIGQLARGMASTVLSGKILGGRRAMTDTATIARLSEAVDESLVGLFTQEMQSEVAEILVEIPRASHAYRQLADATVRLKTLAHTVDEALDPRLRTRIRHLQLGVLHLLEHSDALSPTFHLTQCVNELETIECHLSDLRSRLLVVCARHEIPPMILDRLLDRLNAVRRVAQISVGAASLLARARRPLLYRHTANGQPGALDPFSLAA